MFSSFHLAISANYNMFCDYIAGFPCAWSTFNSRSRPTHRYVNLASGCFRAGFNAGMTPNERLCKSFATSGGQAREICPAAIWA